MLSLVESTIFSFLPRTASHSWIKEKHLLFFSFPTQVPCLYNLPHKFGSLEKTKLGTQVSPRSESPEPAVFLNREGGQEQIQMSISDFLVHNNSSKDLNS